MSGEEKSLRIIEFSGKDWEVWSEKFKARGKRKGYTKLLLGKAKVPTLSEYSLAELGDSDADKETVKLGDSNALGYEDLILSINGSTKAGKVAFNLVKNCKTDEFPEGNYKLAWDRLVNKYSPKTAPSYIELKKKFTNSILESSSDDPDEWITELESLRAEIDAVNISGTKMTDMDFNIHVLGNLPEEYEVAVESLEEKMEDTSVTLDIEDIRTKLNARFARINKKSAKKSDDEQAFNTINKDQITCKNCGKKGHSFRECPSKPRNGITGKSCKEIYKNRLCGYCGKPGHVYKNCNARKRYENEKQEKANLANSSERFPGYSEELGFCCQMVTNSERKIQNGNSKGQPSRKQVRFDDLVQVIPSEAAMVCRVDKWSKKKSVRFDDLTQVIPSEAAKALDKKNAVKKVRFSETVEVIPSDAETAMMCRIDGTLYPEFSSNTVVGDTGASCHMFNSDEGFEDVEDIDEEVQGIGANKIRALKKGKKRCRFVQKDGTEIERVLYPAKYVEGLGQDLFSITAEISNGGVLSSDSNRNLVLKYEDGGDIVFDRRHKTQDGWIAGIDVAPPNGETANLSKDKGAPKQGKRKDVNELHAELGHPGEDVTRATGAHRGFQVTGAFEPCESCAVGKAKQTKMNKEPIERSKVAGERLYLDVSSPRTQSVGGKHHWLLLVDDCSDLSWSYFLKKKKEVKANVIELVKELKAKYGIVVKYIRCDNAGENRALQDACRQEGLGITFEFTTPGTPQQNGRVERKFATLYGRMRAMLQGSKIEGSLKRQLWAEAANTATDLDNILVKYKESKNSFQKFYKNKKKSIISTTRIFGEMVVVTNRSLVKAKLADRGKVCVWLGYAADHAAGTHRVWNPETNKVILTRDVLFLRKSYGDWAEEKQESQSKIASKAPDSMLKNIEDEDSGDVVDSPAQGGQSTPHSEDSGQADESVTKVPTRLVGELKRLNVSYNPEAKEQLDKLDGVTTRNRGESLLETANLILEAAMQKQEVKEKSKYVEPKTFQEAYNHVDPVQRDFWRKAIRKEFRDMTNRKVWRKAQRSAMPDDRRCVKNKWVFKIKRNGTFRARLVACGYSQIPGVDYDQSYSPVIHDITFRTLLLVKIILGLAAKIVDVETAFLEGELEEEIYMECPAGMDSTEDEVLILDRCIYGLVQSARQYHRKAVKILKRIGFEGGEVDPCLFTRESPKFGRVYIGLYVDDNLLVGHPQAINEVIEELRDEGFVLKVEDDLKDYLSCEIDFSEDQKSAWLGQPHLIKNLENSFGKIVKDMREYKTPGTPHKIQVRERDSQKCISKSDQKLYRSGVGMLLYLVKHSRPDIANPVRELSKVLDGATEEAFKEMLRVIKYVLDTKSWGLKIQPTFGEEAWDLVCFCDSDYAGDPDSRKSVSGYILYVRGVPICWRSKAQKTITLSSAEAEWIALSEATKEIMFVLQLFESMKIKVKLPVTVRVDNMGAIFMAKNISTSNRSKHVDVRTKYVNEVVEDGKLKIVYVESGNNDADILTKNLGGELYSKHVKKFIKGRD